MTESKVGFHSPEEPRQITLSELGDFGSKEFDDKTPWNQDGGVNNEGSEKNLHSYSADSFVSSHGSEQNTVSGTSSMSIPLVSQFSDDSYHSQNHQHSTQHRNIPSPIQSELSPPLARSNSRLVSQTSSRTSNVSNRSKHASKRSKSTTSSSTTSSSSSAKSSSSSTSTTNKSNKTSSSSSGNRRGGDAPKISAHSPVKSSYRKQSLPNQQPNTLNITLPTVETSSLLSSNNSEY